WYGPAVLTERPEPRVKLLEDERIKVRRVAEPVLHVNENVVDVNYAVFIEDKAAGGVQEVRETHRMRYLFLPDLALLRAASFAERASCAWMSEAAPDERSWAGCQVLERLEGRE